MSKSKIDIIEKDLSEVLRQTGKLEGSLFAEISLRCFSKEYVAKINLYTVKNGLVYYINSDGNLHATGDSLFSVANYCYKIGKYSPSDKNETKSSTFSYAEIKKLLNL